jgi:hypothetical protein
MPIVPPSRHDLDHACIDWRAVDATTEGEIEQHTASDADTAPLFCADALLAALFSGAGEPRD